MTVRKVAKVWRKVEEGGLPGEVKVIGKRCLDSLVIKGAPVHHVFELFRVIYIVVFYIHPEYTYTINCRVSQEGRKFHTLSPHF